MIFGIRSGSAIYSYGLQCQAYLDLGHSASKELSFTEKLFSTYIFPPFSFINKYILLMKTASETFIEHLIAVVRTEVTAILAVFGDHQRSIQPEGGCTAGFCPKFLLTCQGWCPTCKGMALITKPSQASVFV